jgi:hypothetical protein
MRKAWKVLLLSNAIMPILLADVIPPTKRLHDLPLRFEESLDPTSGGIRYTARGEGYLLTLTPTESWLEWKSDRIRTRILGASPNLQMVAEEPLPGSTNYFVGRAENWKTNVPGYGRVRYHEVYRAVDLVFHGEQGRLEYRSRWY